MVASPETEPGAHPFWYAAVMGVFHANVQHVGAASRNYRFQRVEFLWVRWLGVVPDSSFGRTEAALPKIGFVPDSHEYAFGFLDPSLVLTPQMLSSSSFLCRWAYYRTSQLKKKASQQMQDLQGKAMIGQAFMLECA